MQSLHHAMSLADAATSLHVYHSSFRLHQSYPSFFLDSGRQLHVYLRVLVFVYVTICRFAKTFTDVYYHHDPVSGIDLVVKPSCSRLPHAMLVHPSMVFSQCDQRPAYYF